MTAVYLYCVVKSAKTPSVVRVPRGLPGASTPSALELGGALWLVVADVPLDRYGPVALETALRDLNWVANAAVAHESVVEHFAHRAGTTVLPMKLFTMFSTRERALGDVASRRREIEGILARIAGCEEWGVRVTRASALGGDKAAARSAVGSGAAFLAEKKRKRDEAQAAAAAAAAAAAHSYTALSAVSREARRRDAVPEGVPAPPLLDAAFLVPEARRARFKSAARRLAAGCAAAGAEMTLSGPWPAYNFVQPPEERA